MGIHSEIVADGVADGEIVKNRTDEEVVAYIRSRGIVGPIPKAMISAMRSRLEGEDFARKLANIAKNPVNLFRLLAEYRRGGLVEVADGIEAVYGPGSEIAPEVKPAPIRTGALAALANRANEIRSWEDVLGAYHEARRAENDFLAGYKKFTKEDEEQSDALGVAALNAFTVMMMYPAPSLDALATKLAIYAGDDAHEYCDVRLFQAQMAADAVRLAREISSGEHLLPVVEEQIARAERHLACSGEADDHPDFQAVISIYSELLQRELADA